MFAFRAPLHSRGEEPRNNASLRLMKGRRFFSCRHNEQGKRKPPSTGPALSREQEKAESPSPSTSYRKGGAMRGSGSSPLALYYPTRCTHYCSSISSSEFTQRHSLCFRPPRMINDLLSSVLTQFRFFGGARIRKSEYKVTYLVTSALLTRKGRKRRSRVPFISVKHACYVTIV